MLCIGVFSFGFRPAQATAPETSVKTDFKWLIAENTVVTPTPEFTIVPRASQRPLGASSEEIVAYIYEVWGEKAVKATKVANCESGLKWWEYNPEKNAKLRGITKYSSCGIFQINDPRCEDKSSELYDYKYNIEYAYNHKFKTQGWGAWLTCSQK